MTTPTLATIPVTSICAGGLLDYTIAAGVRARALRDACVAWMPAPSRMMLPVIDALTRKWLLRSHSPYLAEVAAIAGAIDVPASGFSTAATSGAARRLRANRTARRGLRARSTGRFPGSAATSRVARMRGKAGDFDNVTWPGYVGHAYGLRARTFRGLDQSGADVAADADARGCGPTILQPMRSRPGGSISSRPTICCVRCSRPARASPRRAQRLETTPIARPVIYTLVGC